MSTPQLSSSGLPTVAGGQSQDEWQGDGERRLESLSERIQQRSQSLVNGPTVAGLVKFSTTDWPGQIVAVVFLQGCPWRCTYCHNHAILDPRAPGVMEWAEVVEFLRRRQGMLDGVVFSGGEPLIDQALPSALQQVKALGFKTGIHTGGAWPQRLKALLQQDLLDWVGLDIKHLRDKYSQVTGVKASGRAAFASLDIVVESDIAHEVRTTVDPTVHGTEDIVTLIAALRQYRTANGNRIHNHVIQEARPVGAAANNAEAFEDWRLACLLPADVEPSTLRRAA